MKNSITQLSFCSHLFSSPIALSQVFTSIHVHDLMEGWGEASTTSSTAATIQIVKIDQFRDIIKIKSDLKTRGVAAKRGRESDTTLCGAGRVVVIRSSKSRPILHSHSSYTSSQIFFRPALPLINKYITVKPQTGGVGSPPSPTTNSTCALDDRNPNFDGYCIILEKQTFSLLQPAMYNTHHLIPQTAEL